MAGLLLPVAVSGLLVPFRTHIANTDLALVLVLVVVAVAANGNRPAGILAAGSAAISFDFFFTRPYERLSITARADVRTTVLLLIIGIAVTELAVRGRRQRILAVTDETYLAAIGATTGLVAAGSSTLEVTKFVCGQLTALLGLRGCRFERSSFGGLPRLEVDGRLRWGERYWDLDQYGMPTESVELLVHAGGAVFGRFVLEPVPGRTAALAARRVATILANQTAAALASQTRTGRM